VAWRFTSTPTSNTLWAVDVVDRKTVWAAGGGFLNAANDGTIVRTVDGGRTWQNLTPPGGASRQFRDVEAFDRDNALVLDAAGAGTILRTADGGATWRVVFQNPDPNGFYDCIAFFDHRRGLAVGDPVNGKFPILATSDSGRTWRPASSLRMPDALDGEGAFATTGTCLVTVGPRDAWFGTSNETAAPHARVFHTQDAGRTWTVATAPVPGPVGIGALSFRDRWNGLAISLNRPPPFDSGPDESAVVRTSDGGRSWTLVGAPAGVRGGVAWIPGYRDAAVVAGLHGSDVSFNGGRTWTLFDRTFLLGINCLPAVGCWAVGGRGLAAELTIRHR
jgi:photosystem II stability/assembly factor-like uncharacterized protein